jgi:peptide subunit release factor 1 (eRF1)
MWMGAKSDVTQEALRSLAETRAEAETVISIYLDLDPAHFATAPARASEIDSLLDATHREIESRPRPHAELQALRRALDNARERLGPVGASMQGAHALALFVCEPLGLDQVLRLPHPVASATVISDAPFIAPLQEQGPVGRICVALVDERFARILPDVRARLHEQRLSTDLSNATVADVERAAAPVLASLQRAHEDLVLAELRAHATRDCNARAATGLEAVLRALAEQRVETLLYDAALAAPGMLCPRCGWMSPDGEHCPADGERLQRRENIVEEARQSALRQSAELLPLRQRPELGPLGRIAATLRF